MNIRNLEIENFKMFKNLNLIFEPGFNILVGDNGVGKTSILEAIAVGLAGFISGMGQVPTRNILKSDFYYSIVRDSNGTPNKNISSASRISCDISFEDKPYFWVREREGSNAKTKTKINPKDICRDVSRLVNSNDINKLWPILSYQGAARNWVKKRNDAGKKRRVQIHDRRCGYIGCLDNISDIKSIQSWCMDMEWLIVRMKHNSKNYEEFCNIVSEFMCKMNDNKKCELYFNPQEERFMYSEDDKLMYLSDMSAGYQSIMNMVIDLAYRMAIINPEAGENTRFAEGIVIIDELDTNLHPKWQWKISETLTNMFPNIQFIVATHSPIIVSSSKNANIINISKNGVINYLEDGYALSVDEILQFRLESCERPKFVNQLINSFYEYIDDEEYDDAKKVLQDLEEKLGKGHPQVSVLRSEYQIENDKL